MDDKRKLKYGELGEAIKRLLREHGLDTTYPRMVELLQSEGISGCSLPTFHERKRDVMRECQSIDLPIPDESPAKLPPPPIVAPAPVVEPVYGDSLIEFCKFAALVQEMGIDRAQRYLGIMRTHFPGAPQVGQ